VSNGLVYTYLF